MFHTIHYIYLELKHSKVTLTVVGDLARIRIQILKVHFMSATIDRSKSVRVLVVDDSAVMRKIISRILSQDPEIEVVGQAGDAFEARTAIKALDPDVVTLDVQMPDMDGLEFLQKIMELRPMPVIMVSGMTSEGTDAAIRALELGAVDCVAKPSSHDPDTFGDLARKVKIAAQSKLQTTRKRVLKSPAARIEPRMKLTPKDAVIAIGSSTGGVDALVQILTHFPENCPPTVITQHMPAGFTRNFAARLDKITAPKVSEAIDGLPLKQGHVYLAPGGTAHLEVIGSERFFCRLTQTESVNGHRPSVDVMFSSVAENVRSKAIGVILTGMGNDGAAGLLAMRMAAARTIGQDEETSVIYGMPRVAAELGAVEKQVPLDRIAMEILKCGMTSLAA